MGNFCNGRINLRGDATSAVDPSKYCDNISK